MTDREPRSEADKQLIENVETHGWSVMKIGADDNTWGWAFSVGLFHTFSHPEIVIFGMRLETMGSIINAFGEEIRNGKHFEPGVRYDDMLQGADCLVAQVEKRWYRAFLGYARWFYTGDDFPCVQCVWPDRAGALPGESKSKADWTGRQPRLDMKDPEAAAVGPWLESMNH